MEEMFGLGDNQLRELMETELPVPREDLITRKAVEKVDKEKVFQLPDLNEFITESKANENEEQEVIQKIDRRNYEQYSRAMQLNPFADSDESLFIQEVRLYFLRSNAITHANITMCSCSMTSFHLYLAQANY